MLSNIYKKISDKDTLTRHFPEDLGRRLDNIAFWKIWLTGLAVILVVILFWKQVIFEPYTQQAVSDTMKITALQQEAGTIEKQTATNEHRIPEYDRIPEILDYINGYFLTGGVVTQELNIGQQTQENERIINVPVTIRVSGDLDKILNVICLLQEQQTYPIMIQDMDYDNRIAQVTVIIPILN